MIYCTIIYYSSRQPLFTSPLILYPYISLHSYTSPHKSSGKGRQGVGSLEGWWAHHAHFHLLSFTYISQDALHPSPLPLLPSPLLSSPLISSHLFSSPPLPSPPACPMLPCPLRWCCYRGITNIMPHCAYLCRFVFPYLRLPLCA